jgi:hypothetical protein
VLHEEPSAVLHEEPSAVLHEEPSAVLNEEPSAMNEEPSATRLAETTPAPPAPTIWVDAKTFEIVRIESHSGVTVDFGPVIAFGEVRFPESMTIREPGREPVRFDILGVVPVNAPAAEFTQAWLLAPTSDDDAFPAGSPQALDP